MKVAVVILAVAIVGAFAQEAADSGIPEFKCTSTNSFVCTVSNSTTNLSLHVVSLGCWGTIIQITNQNYKFWKCENVKNVKHIESSC